MKQTWKVGILILACLMIAGCSSSEPSRMADLAESTVESQNRVHERFADTQNRLAELNLEIQAERSQLQQEKILLNKQFEQLEQDRREQHQSRRTELAWSESLRFLAIVIAAVMPLFLCAYLIWAASRKSVGKDEVNAILIRELTSAEPRLIAAPNMPAIESKPKRLKTPDPNEQTSTKRRKTNVSRRKDRDSDPRR